MGLHRPEKAVVFTLKIKQFDCLLLKIIVVLALATGYFFNIKFTQLFGLQITFFTISIVIIFILGFYLTLKTNLKHLLFFLIILAFYLLISTGNKGFATYGIIFISNIFIIYLLTQKNIEFSFLSNLGHIGMAIGLLIFLYYIYEVAVYGGEVKSNKELWNSSGYMFRFTMGRVFSFQGFSINPNIAIMPFLASFLMSQIKGGSPLLSFIYILFIIIVSISTNSRGSVAMVVLTLGLFLLMRYSIKNILKVFLISSLSLFLITLMFADSKVLDQNYSNTLAYLDNISDKVKRSTDNKRLEKVKDSIKIYEDNPVFGGGLSVVKERYGHSAENGYVEFLAVFGSVGVLIFTVTAVLWLHRRSCCLNNEIAWPLVMIYLIVNIFNTGYMHPVNSLILGLSFMCLNKKNHEKYKCLPVQLTTVYRNIAR